LIELYALCDQASLDQRHLTLEDFVDLARSHNASIIQYRNKSKDFDFITQQLVTLRQLWDKTLIINDAILLHPFCDGVHLGQEDLLKYDKSPFFAIDKVRNIIGTQKVLGLSTHNEEEILMANKLDLDYIGLGAYRATNTKEDAAPLKEDLDRLAALSKHRVAAIGGVKFDDDFENVTYRVIGSALFGVKK